MSVETLEGELRVITSRESQRTHSARPRAAQLDAARSRTAAIGKPQPRAIDLLPLAWPLERLQEALEILARHAGLAPTVAVAPLIPLREEPSAEALDHWLDQAGKGLGIEIEAVNASVAEVDGLLRSSAPAILRYRHDDDCYVLLLVGATTRTIRLLGADLRVVAVPFDAVREVICGKAEGVVAAEIDAVLEPAGFDVRQYARAKRAMLADRLAIHRFTGCWLLRMPPRAGVWRQLCHAHVPQRLGWMLGVFAALYGLEVIGWSLIGSGALGGRLDLGWLVAWVLLLLGMVPLRLTGGWLQGTLSIEVGMLLKKRLLVGALQMSPQVLRQQGVGQLLSRVIDSQALESLSLNGGFAVLLALIELGLAAWVLALGASGGWHVLLLALFLIATLALCWRYYRRLRHWTRARLALTHDLIERMLGHRTRLIQRAATQRHDNEDEQLEQYFNLSRHFDQSAIPLVGGLARGWLILGLLGLAATFIVGQVEATAMAVGVAGVLLAQRAFADIASGVAAVLRAVVAGSEIAPLFKAAGEPCESTAALESLGSVKPAHESTGAGGAGGATKVLVQARDVVFRHRVHSGPVLDRCNLTIHHGDRLLLEGVSGGGKSTLAALLVGLKTPDAGLLLLDGLDRATLGEHWRRLATGAPQFQENHVLTGTLAFNLLMGRQWPASNADLKEAEEVCRELGLGELLDRMPSGLMQIVGETGWQLSHGERSRVFLARALLQNAELVVLDESFAALDPDTLQRCLHCALSRAATLLVIAHP